MHSDSHTLSTEQVSQDTLEANALNRYLAKTSLQDTRAHLHEVPTFIYIYKNTLTSCTGLVTGEHSSHRVPSYTFKGGCCWSEVPGGSLLITGGGWSTVREVVRIATRRELAVAHCTPFSLLGETMLQCITLHISTSLEG
jgi:hypothetical protein